jgi:hypothetical protein
VADLLGVARPTVTYHARRLGIALQSTAGRRYDWVAIRTYYEAGHTFAECRERFGFCGASWTQAVRRGDIQPRPRGTPIDQLLATGASRTNLRMRLIADGLKPACCEDCGISEWRERPLPLQLHHVNGVGDDNRLENLRILCPNCHALTDNWGGRNRGRLRLVEGDEAA